MSTPRVRFPVRHRVPNVARFIVFRNGVVLDTSRTRGNTGARSAHGTARASDTSTAPLATGTPLPPSARFFLLFGGLAVAVYVLPFIAHIFIVAFPASLYVVLSAATYFLARRHDSPWLKAAASVSLPATLGFGLLTISLIVFNWIFDPLEPSATKDIASYELWLLSFARTLPVWVKLSWLKGAVLLAILVPIARRWPEWKPITRFLWLKRYGGRAVAALTVATSFSFFVDDDVLEQDRGAVVTHITMVLARSRREERDQLGKYLALRSVHEVFKSASISDPQRLFELLRNVDKADSLSVDDRATLMAHVWGGYGHGELTIPPSSAESEPDADPMPYEDLGATRDAMARDPEGVLASQRKKAETAARMAAREEDAAVEELLHASSASATAPLKAVADALVTAMAGDVHGFLATQATEYLDKVTDNKLDDLVAPYVKQAVERLRQAMRGEGALASFRQSPDAVISNSIRWFATDAVEQLAARSQDEARAARAYSISIDEADSLLSRASEDADQAEHFADTYGRVVAGTTLHADDHDVDPYGPGALQRMNFFRRQISRPDPRQISRPDPPPSHPPTVADRALAAMRLARDARKSVVSTGEALRARLRTTEDGRDGEVRDEDGRAEHPIEFHGIP